MSWWKWLLVLVLVGHTYALYTPGGTGTGLFSRFPAGTDKAIHVALFAAPAFVLRMITPRWWPILILALHAPISELVQGRFVRHRSGDPLDLLADVVGLALGVAAAEWLRRRGLGLSSDCA